MGDVLKVLKLKKGTVILLVLVPILLMFLLVFNVFAAELSMPDVNLNAQETEFVVPVQIKDANDVGGFQFEITYDSSVLELEKIENGELINGWITDSSLGNPLKVIGASISAPITTQSGTLVELYFKVVNDSDTSTNLDFSMVKLTDKDGDEISCSSQGAVVTIPQKQNTKPTASISVSASSVYTKTTVELDGSGSSDTDNDTLSYSWSFKSKPNGSNATIENADQAQASFTPDVAGDYEVQLVVNDSKEDSDAAVVTIKAKKKNSKPVAVIELSESAGFIGDTITLNGSKSSDQDNDTLSYSWSFKSKPNGSNATIENADQAQASFTPDVAGNYEVQLVVNDSKEDSDVAVVTIKAKKRWAYMPIIPKKIIPYNIPKPKTTVKVYTPKLIDNISSILYKPKKISTIHLPQPKDNVTIIFPSYKLSPIVDYLRQLYYHK